MGSITYSFLNFELIAKSRKGTHQREDFKVLIVVIHDVCHETEPL
jgi:hypothetical protein